LNAYHSNAMAIIKRTTQFSGGGTPIQSSTYFSKIISTIAIKKERMSAIRKRIEPGFTSGCFGH
jgi:hypothetical protein